MGRERIPPQIKDVQVGDDLVFIRETTDGFGYYCKPRKVHVVEIEADKVLIALHTPLRGMWGEIRRDITFTKHGFPMCRWVPKHLLIRNCRRI